MVVGPKLAVGDIGGNIVVIVVDDSENNIYYFMLLVFSKEHKYITKSQAIGIRGIWAYFDEPTRVQRLMSYAQKDVEG